MDRDSALVNIERKAWHACGEEMARALFAWRDYAEFAWSTPTEGQRDLALVATETLLTICQAQEESDILNTWRMMLEVKRAA